MSLDASAAASQPAAKIVVAIDGPAGAGKSTVARHLARHFGLLNLETGAMYRAFALKALRASLLLDESSGLEAQPSGAAALQFRGKGPSAPAAAPIPAAAPTMCIEYLQVRLQRTSRLHGLQDRDYIPRSRPCSLQFLNQILYRSPRFQVDPVHRPVLRLHAGLLHHLRRSVEALSGFEGS